MSICMYLICTCISYMVTDQHISSPKKVHWTTKDTNTNTLCVDSLCCQKGKFLLTPPSPDCLHCLSPDKHLFKVCLFPGELLNKTSASCIVVDVLSIQSYCALLLNRIQIWSCVNLKRSLSGPSELDLE